MRLLLLAQFFPPDIGGEERHVYNLANILAGRGHQVAVATQSMAGFPAFERLPSGVRVHRFATTAMNLPKVYSTDRRHHLPFPDPLGARNLSHIIQSEKPDVVHAHNWIINSVLPLRHTGRQKFGLVLTLHDYSAICATKRLMHKGRICEGPRPVKCLKCSINHYGPIVGPVTAVATAAMHPWKEHAVDYVVCVSRAVAEGNGIVDGPTASVIPNFILDSALQPPLSDTASKADNGIAASLSAGDYLLFVGDLSAQKGILALLRAYDSLHVDRPRLLLIGRRTPDTPTRLPNGAELHFGWPHNQIMVAFRHCLAAVLPSIWPDPCPTTVLEAMASGRPVITTSTGGMVDMVVHEESGLLVTPDSERELADAIKRLAVDDALRARLGGAARERARAFTASAVAERLEAVYQRVAPMNGSLERPRRNLRPPGLGA
jgi:glycosyltransferase involved in cell wall biosynthesis